MAIAWVFPGQGSQKVGMAEALLSIEGSRERFAMASELLGRDLLAICQGKAAVVMARMASTTPATPSPPCL